jgi:peptidoglycan/LPS O-acetylase OafA/YrhL
MIHTNKKNYRWDIQGLRAIAVLAVVIFHINPKLLPGGYLGVDVFFVISGYLILGFIWQDLQQQRFSLVNFYGRRLKRLFPAFFVMVLFTSFISYFVLLPEETVTYAESLLSSILYSSNIYFYFQSNYFSTALEYAPLLHTWSLAVEEQFYFAFPILLIWVYKTNPARIMFVLTAIMVLSLLLSELLLYSDKSFSFYASPTRFWQFIVGGLLAIHPCIINYGKNLSTSLSDALAITGLFILTSCLFYYNQEVLFPGINAVLPTFATGLILFAGKSSNFGRGFIYKVLSCRLAKFFGKISYSLYLWHWPIIVFYQLIIKSKTNFSEQAMLFSVAILLGYISWFVIERRSTALHIGRTSIKVIWTSIFASLLLVVIGAAFLTGLPYRYSEQQIKYSAYLNYDRKDYYRQGSCFLTSYFNNISFFDKQLCISYDKLEHNTLLIGDSHAAQWYRALKSTKKTNENISQVTSSGCKPIVPFKGAKRCTHLMQWAFDELIQDKRFETIIIAARWKDKDINTLLATVEYLSEYSTDIIVFGPSIEYDLPLPRLLASKESAKEVNDYRNYQMIKNRDKFFMNAFNNSSASYLSVFNIICPEDDFCLQLTKRGNPIQYDSNHLTYEGARELILELKKQRSF